MDPLELLRLVLREDALTARQWVADAARLGFSWTNVRAPEALDATELAVFAGLVEVMAARAQQQPPAWTSHVPKAPAPVFLVGVSREMRHFRRQCELEGPAPWRTRNVFAPREFLTFA